MPIIPKLHLVDEASQREIVVYINAHSQLYIEEQNKEPEECFWFYLDEEDWDAMKTFVDEQFSNNG